MVRAFPFSLIPFFLAAAYAAEVTVERRPFSVVNRFEAVVTTPTPLVVRAGGLLDEVSGIAEHGARVEAGAVLVKFETAKLEQEISAAKGVFESASLDAARSELNLRQLDESAPLQIEELKTAARRAKEDLDDFTSRRQKALEENAASIADEVERDRSLKVLIPAEAGELTLKRKQADLALRQGEESIRHELKTLGEEVARAEQDAKSAMARVTELEKLREKSETRAPAAGWWFHGAPASDAGFVEGVAGHFVSAAAPMTVVAKVSAATAGVLASGDEGTGHFAGKVDPVLPLKIESIAPAADAEGKWPVQLAATWPEGLIPVPGSVVEVDFATHRKDGAIAIPSEALRYGANGWTVDVKLADGKTEARKVVPGLVSGDRTEIVSGLEAGQVIIVP